MKTPINLLVLMMLLYLISCSPKVDLENERIKLLQADKEWSDAANSNDMERLWSFWLEDSKMLLSANKTLNGLSQIKEFTTQVRTDPNFEISWEAQGADISASGEMGYTYGVGKVTRTGENGEPITITNPYLVVWKKQPDGQWKGVIEK